MTSLTLECAQEPGGQLNLLHLMTQSPTHDKNTIYQSVQ